MFFTGLVNHQVDDKGRVRIPSKFYTRSGEGASPEDKNIITYYFMAGSQGCISVYLQSALEQRIAKLRSIEETGEEVVEAKRRILETIEEVVTDRQGRVVIPSSLRSYAGIDRDIVTVGNDDHFEIWSKEVRDKQREKMTLSSAYKQVGFF